MKVSSLSPAFLLSLAPLIHSNPIPASLELIPRQGGYPVTFYGAGDASFTINITPDNQNHPINNPLSVTSIESYSVMNCDVVGVDGSNTFVVGGRGPIVVGPPQTQVSANCQI